LIRQAAVKALDRVMECGQAFGCEILCGPVHSAIGVFSGVPPTDDEFKAGVDALRQVGEKAQARGIKVAVEYLNRFENYFLTTAAQTKRFVQAVNHPSVRMMYDSFHANIEEKDQEAAILACKDETIHVHVSENDRGVPGSGDVNWDSFWSGIEQSGYDGYLTIEAFGRALPALAAATRVWRDLFPDAMELCRDGIGFIRQNIGRS
jgi:D-psicose/D-tagatose/L-ribulose 3-epimerase